MEPFWNNLNKETKTIFISTAITLSLFCLVAIGLWLFFVNRSRPYYPSNCVITETIVMPEGFQDVKWLSVEIDSANYIHAIGAIDSIACTSIRNGIIQKERIEGRLLTTDEMIERIPGYYDKLIDVLIALFVVFTMISYFAIRTKFSQKYEEDKEKIFDDIQTKIMNDYRFINNLINGVSTQVEEKFLTKTDIKDIKDELQKHKDFLDILISEYDQIMDRSIAADEIDLSTPKNE